MIRFPRARDQPGERPAPAAPARPTPSPGARNFVVVVLDSLRYDAWAAAAPVNLAALGAVERRWSYASWTAPSHYNLLMGLLPHSSPSEVYASEYYKQDFLKYAQRLGVAEMSFRDVLPSLFLPSYLRGSLGYVTRALVSMPVLNEHTVLNRDFDEYRLMPRHNDMAAMVDQLVFDENRPTFYLLNVGETHYPYALPNEDPSRWPRISGVHGVIKRLDGAADGASTEPREFFDQSQLAALRGRQVTALEHVDGVIAKLFDRLPSNTWVIVTSDHGELFGEDRYFGHGPILHPKVLEVPFVEGLVP